ncbi:MAG: ferritin family protein [Sedimentisphaerales bacterium]|nr:ferritin family protein [Sedimentisphaerales bacterium]
MAIPFSADEVFEMAEQIERNGATFYRTAAEKFTDIGPVLLDLARMEDEHLKTFTTMRADLSGGELDTPVYDPDGEVQMYLRVMADGNIFDLKTDPAQQLAGITTSQAVLKRAMQAERDSIAFYVGLKESVSKKAGKDKVQAIIREEVGHMAILNEKLQALK